jgi:hypothetical protein
MATRIGDNSNNNIIGTSEIDLCLGLDGDDLLEGQRRFPLQ